MISPYKPILSIVILLLFLLPGNVSSSSASSSSILKFNSFDSKLESKKSPYLDPQKISRSHNNWIGDQDQNLTISPDPSPVSISFTSLSPNINANTDDVNFINKSSLLRRSVMNDEYFDPTVSTSQLRYNELVKTIDNTPTAIINRFLIYIKFKDVSALFSELKGNKLARSVQVYEGIEGVLVAIAECSFDEKSDCYKSFQQTANTLPESFVASVLAAFIHFNVDISKSNNFSNNLRTFNACLAYLERPFLAFYILTQNLDQIFAFSKGSVRTNFYAVENAILMLPDESIQFNIVEWLISHYPAFSEQSQLHYRLLKRSSDIKLCESLIQEYPRILTNFNLATLLHYNRHKHPKKIDFFISKLEYKTVHDILDGDFYIKPQKVHKKEAFKLPFLACPLPISEFNHPRWSVYAEAFGQEFIDIAKNLIYTSKESKSSSKKKN